MSLGVLVCSLALLFCWSMFWVAVILTNFAWHKSSLHKLASLEAMLVQTSAQRLTDGGEVQS